MTSQLQYHILDINPSSYSVTKQMAILHPGACADLNMFHVILLVTRILSGFKISSFFEGSFTIPAGKMPGSVLRVRNRDACSHGENHWNWWGKFEIHDVWTLVG